nr:MAG TPA: hypothetical protein [Caudoviricetes sp.]
MFWEKEGGRAFFYDLRSHSNNNQQLQNRNMIYS